MPLVHLTLVQFEPSSVPFRVCCVFGLPCVSHVVFLVDVVAVALLLSSDGKLGAESRAAVEATPAARPRPRLHRLQERDQARERQLQGVALLGDGETSLIGQAHCPLSHAPCLLSPVSYPLSPIPCPLSRVPAPGVMTPRQLARDCDLEGLRVFLSEEFVKWDNTLTVKVKKRAPAQELVSWNRDRN